MAEKIRRGRWDPKCSPPICTKRTHTTTRERQRKPTKAARGARTQQIHLNSRSAPVSAPLETATAMSSTQKRSANAVGARTARPCDNCLCTRARWYCAADDAFLCQACDASVHSANQLARRHERVSIRAPGGMPEPLPPWTHGFRRKARTPRQSKPRAAVESLNGQILPLVPDLSNGDESLPADDEQLIYRVPVYVPVASPPDPVTDVGSGVSLPQDRAAAAAQDLIGFVPSDADVDLESLLGKDFDSECFCMEALGLMDAGDDRMEQRVKAEEAEEPVLTKGRADSDLDNRCEALDLKFGYESPAAEMACEEEAVADGKRIFLRLDYETVITAWGGQGSPWMTGERPSFDPDDCWPENCGFESHQQQYHVAHLAVGGGDSGREARVSRYREKRRSRLFAKKIRYEVRKLNAEKRPRMKGRFVKRASLFAAEPPANASAATPVFSF